MVRMAVFTAVATLAAACGDSPVAPGAASPDGRTASALLNSSEAASQGTLSIDPTQSKTYYFGDHKVYIPAGAVCADGGYGPLVWDMDCTPATTVTTMTVTYTNGARPSVTFGKDVRFRPAAGSVILGLKVQGQLDEQLKYAVLYTPSGTTLRIDESQADPTLRAWRASGNVIARRLKHFSGYNVSLGYYDETCPDNDGDGICDSTGGTSEVTVQ